MMIKVTKTLESNEESLPIDAVGFHPDGYEH